MMDKHIVSFMKKNLVLSKDQEQIIIFATQLIVGTVYSVGSIVLVSLALGNLKETIIVLLTAAVMRLAAGGAHCGSALRCAIAGALIFPTLGLIPKYYFIENAWFYLVPIILAFISIMKYAPAEAPGKPLTNQDYIKKMYRISLILSVLIIALAFYCVPINSMVSTGIVTGLSWQALTITPLGFKLISGFDKILYTIVRR